MTVEAPTPVQIKTSLNSCYRAGWPTPDEFIEHMERHEDEEFDEYRERLHAFAENHRKVMTEIVINALQNPGGLKVVFRLGKLAKKDLTQALYLLNYSEEA